MTTKRVTKDQHIPISMFIAQEQKRLRDFGKWYPEYCEKVGRPPHQATEADWRGKYLYWLNGGYEHENQH